MPWAGFEPAIPATERPQTYILDRAATGIGQYLHVIVSVTSRQYDNEQFCLMGPTEYLSYPAIKTVAEPVSVMPCTLSLIRVLANAQSAYPSGNECK
jgi:hypothetical protein